jgi:hypothetical protein
MARHHLKKCFELPRPIAVFPFEDAAITPDATVANAQGNGPHGNAISLDQRAAISGIWPIARLKPIAHARQPDKFDLRKAAHAFSLLPGDGAPKWTRRTEVQTPPNTGITHSLRTRTYAHQVSNLR